MRWRMRSVRESSANLQSWRFLHRLVYWIPRTADRKPLDVQGVLWPTGRTRHTGEDTLGTVPASTPDPLTATAPHQLGAYRLAAAAAVILLLVVRD